MMQPGSPMAGKMPLSASIPLAKKLKPGRFLPHAPAPISTLLPSTVRAASGSPDKPAFMADPASGKMDVWDAPKGVGPYGITATPSGDIYYVSLAGSFLGKPDMETGETTIIEPKTENAGTRRVWSDSKGRLWVSEWNAGNVSLYDPASKSWTVYKLPGHDPHAYAVYVNDKDKVWVSDFGANAILSFDPISKSFQDFRSDKPDAAVRQLNGRAGEVWGAESGADRLVVIRE
jgi:virginiamycin B lyase